MRRSGWMWSCATMVAIAGLLAGCGGSSSSTSSAASSSSTSGGTASTSSASGSGAATGSPVVIGSSLSLSGDFSADGQAFQRGYQLWANDINKAGGLLGHPVKLDIVSDASSPAQVVTNYQKLISSDHAKLVFGPFSTLLTVPASKVVNRYGYAFVEGAGGAPAGVRQRTAQRLRRQPAGGRQPGAVREVGRFAAGVRAPEDGGVRHQQRPVHPATDPAGAEDHAGGGNQDGLQQGVPGRGDRLHADRERGGEQQGRGGRARIGRRTDGVGVHPRLHPAALQPQGVHRHGGSRPGRRLREGGRGRQHRRHHVPERLVSGVRQRREPEAGQRVRRQVRRNPVRRERRRRGGLLGRPGGRPGRRRDAQPRQREDNLLPAQRSHSEQRPGSGEVRHQG